jgi:two-component system chemotaxis response regulator CheB
VLSDQALVIGGSAGSMEALLILFSKLPEDYPIPVMVAVHLHPSDTGELVDFFRAHSGKRVKEACEKEAIQSGCIYFAPSNYHLLVEPDKTFSLSVDDKVNYARPSIDLLFESAAFAYLEGLTGILLTGANQDGAKGICTIKKFGGLTMVQDPLTAKYPVMPQAAIDTGCVDRVLSVENIGELLNQR